MQPWFEEFAAEIDEGNPRYLVCTDCDQVALPPRTVCPECGTRSLEERPLSETATVTSSTQIHSTVPAYSDQTPYTVIIATFDEGVRLTGQLRETSEIELGERVTVGVEQRDDGGWLVTFSPID